MFRTSEISGPQYASNNLRFITVKSQHLKGRGDICVFVPPLDDLNEVSLVILLHGVYGSSWSWSQKGGVHVTAWEMMQKGLIKPMVIAMPSDGLWGDGSGYMPHADKNFEKWIVEDVPNAVMQHLPMVTAKSAHYIAGLSMGGFGALRLGVKYSDVFSAVSGHSSITSLDQMELFVEESIEEYLQEDKTENSVFGIIERNINRLPRIRFDCGSEDPLLDHNRLLHQQLLKNNLEHIYEEFAGGHEWGYWKEHIKKTLLFFEGIQ